MPHVVQRTRMSVLRLLRVGTRVSTMDDGLVLEDDHHIIILSFRYNDIVYKHRKCPSPFVPLFTSNSNAFAAEHVTVSADLHILYTIIKCTWESGLRITYFPPRLTAPSTTVDPDPRCPVNNIIVPLPAVNTMYTRNRIRLEYVMYYPIYIYIYTYF